MTDRRELARVWAEEKPSVRIGKGGVTEGVLEEVRRQLKQQRMIKVRILRSALTDSAFDELVAELAVQTSTVVRGRRGQVVVLSRKGR